MSSMKPGMVLVLYELGTHVHRSVTDDFNYMYMPLELTFSLLRILFGLFLAEQLLLRPEAACFLLAVLGARLGGFIQQRFQSSKLPRAF